jgi:phospholipase/carboxylesterase
VNGYSWWPLRLAPDGTVLREPPPAEFAGSAPCAAAEAVLSWLDALDAKVGQNTDAAGIGAIAIMGFSQGGCQVTSLLRLRPERFACGVNCSGFVAPGSFEGDAALAAARPPMFWGYDPADPVIGPERIAELGEWAPRHTDLEARAYPDIAHSICAEELEHIAAFLARHVALAGGAHPAVEAQP